MQPTQCSAASRIVRREKEKPHRVPVGEDLKPPVPVRCALDWASDPASISRPRPLARPASFYPRHERKTRSKPDPVARCLLFVFVLGDQKNSLCCSSPARQVSGEKNCTGSRKHSVNRPAHRPRSARCKQRAGSKVTSSIRFRCLHAARQPCVPCFQTLGARI